MYFVTLVDKGPVPFKLRHGPLSTYKEALWWAEREIAAAIELFQDARKNVSYSISKE
jgi:hypothetical protein